MRASAILRFRRVSVDECDCAQAKLPAEKRKVQLAVDNELQELLQAGPDAEFMKPYLTSYFTIVPGQPPHAIKF